MSLAAYEEAEATWALQEALKCFLLLTTTTSLAWRAGFPCVVWDPLRFDQFDAKSNPGDGVGGPRQGGQLLPITLHSYLR